MHHISLEEYCKCDNELYIVAEKSSFPTCGETRNQHLE
jgi:hypothetical protein